MDDPSIPSSAVGPSESDPNRRPIKMRSAGWAQALARVCSPELIQIMFRCSASPALGRIWVTSLRSAWPRISLATDRRSRVHSTAVAGEHAGRSYCGGRRTPNESWGSSTTRFRIGSPTCFFWRRRAMRLITELGWALGWSASVLAVGTAYIRAMGARRGAAQDFCGPVAKQQRMFLLTVGCVLAAENILPDGLGILFWILVVITSGHW